jgi:methionine-gamma-lyase
MKKADMQKLGVRTQAIHAGESPDATTGASTPNLVMSSTFVVDEEVSFSAHNISDETPFVYTRWANPTTSQLESKLATLEGAAACVAFSSGMAASAAVMFNHLGQGDHIVASNTNYPGTAEFLRDTLPRMGVEVTPVDASRIGDIETALRPNTRMLWIETPSNPLLRITDIKAAADLAHRHGALLAVDSTFATPIATRPLSLGADLVVHSLTKYIGGHGDAMGGAVAGRSDLIGRLRGEGVIHYGGVISPFNAWLILRGMATLPLRMRAHQENALQVAEFLEAHPRVEQVFYPGLPSHPQHELARSQMHNFSGMLSFRVNDPRRLAQKMMRELAIIHYAVSLGHHRSLVYLLATEDLIRSSYRLSGEELEKYRSAAGEGLFRLSVGLEDAADLCADLDAVL